MKYYSLMLLIFMSCINTADAMKKNKKAVWPEGTVEVRYLSGIDRTEQPAMIYAPESGGKNRPLLVALHTWSGDYRQRGGIKYAEWCIQNEWYMIHPDFRGPNWTSQAMGSEYVVGDIVSAVEYMEEKYSVDENRIYLMGGSGGGHAALLLAGRKPELWTAVSAWCGISDIQKWWEETRLDPKNSRYAEHIEKAVGGKPQKSSGEADECKQRSPVAYLHRARQVKLDINHGVLDGRTGSVSFTHSLYAFNLICREKDRIPEQEIEQFYRDTGKPASLKTDSLVDSLYGDREPLFRRVSDNVRITIFNGGHENIFAAGLNWLSRQKKNGEVVWKIKDPVMIRAWGDETGIEK
jgi:pimeloyl-ACP methyl ester carboxylesterase